MKKALRASVLLNVALAVSLFALLEQRHSDFVPPASDIAKTDAPVEVGLASGEVGPPAGEVESIGERSAVVEESPAAEPPSHSGQARRKEQPIVMPLVFQKVDLGRLNLNGEQLHAIEDLRQRFVDEIGGLERDPSDPTYAEKWQRSQPGLDNDLRGMIGITAYQNYQIEATGPVEQAVQ